MRKVDLFLDSGAFSAWSRGVEIKIEDYIAFIKKHRKYLSLYAVLDVIGDPEGTLRNQHIMEEAGLSPMPCFHFGEPIRYLKKYIDEYDYVALGGMAKMGNRPEMIEFLDKCFDVICDKKGLPQVKIHGFGVTSIQVMKKYPFYSVDSTSWLMTARMGKIYVPHKKPDGTWDYLEDLPNKKLRKVSVSTQSPDAKQEDGHFANMSKHQQNEILEWLEIHGYGMGKSHFRKVPAGYELKEGERWVGCSAGVGELKDDDQEFGRPPDKGSKNFIEVVEVPGVSNDYVQRDIMNAKFFKELEGKFPKWPWAWKRPVLQGFGF